MDDDERKDKTHSTVSTIMSSSGNINGHKRRNWHVYKTRKGRVNMHLAECHSCLKIAVEKLIPNSIFAREEAFRLRFSTVTFSMFTPFRVLYLLAWLSSWHSAKCLILFDSILYLFVRLSLSLGNVCQTFTHCFVLSTVTMCVLLWPSRSAGPQKQ